MVVHNWIQQINVAFLSGKRHNRELGGYKKDTHKHLLPVGYLPCMFINKVMSSRSSDDVQVWQCCTNIGLGTGPRDSVVNTHIYTMSDQVTFSEKQINLKFTQRFGDTFLSGKELHWNLGTMRVWMTRYLKKWC